MKYTVILSFLLLLPLILIWWWAGKRLPPASVINCDLKKEKKDELSQSDIINRKECPTEDPYPIPEVSLPPGAREGGTFLIASDFMYVNGPPQLNTVGIRAELLQYIATIFLTLLWFHPDADSFLWLEEWVIASPFIWCTVAVIALVIALFLGAIRQTFIALLSRAGVIPCLDESGRPTFLYMGDVPHEKWLHTPWLRAISWVVVSLASVFAAVVGAILQEVWFMTDMFALTLVSILLIRWLISSIPRLFYLLSSSGDSSITINNYIPET
jgi:hypothetical protein